MSEHRADPACLGVVPTDRRPVVLPGRRAGLAIADARELRVTVDDAGSVVVQRSGRQSEVLVAAGRLRALAVVTPEQAPRAREARKGLVGLLTDDGVAATLSLAHYGAGAETLDAQDLVETSGLAAVARAAGAPVRAATAQEAADVLRAGRRRSLPTRTRPERASTVAAVVALVLAFLSLPAADELVSPALVVLAMAVAAPATVALVRRRRRLRRLIATAPALPGGTVVGTALGPEYGGLAHATLTLAPEALVLHDRITETWTPGPALGGVTRYVVTPHSVVFADDAGRPLLVLDPQVWIAPGAPSRLEDAAVRLGLRVTTNGTGPDGLLSPHSLATRSDHPAAIVADADTGSGSLAGPPLLHLASWVLVWAAAAAAYQAGWAVVLVPVALALAAGCLDSWWQLAGWARRQRAARAVR